MNKKKKSEEQHEPSKETKDLTNEELTSDEIMDAEKSLESDSVIKEAKKTKEETKKEESHESKMKT